MHGIFYKPISERFKKRRLFWGYFYFDSGKYAKKGVIGTLWNIVGTLFQYISVQKGILLFIQRENLRTGPIPPTAARLQRTA